MGSLNCDFQFWFKGIPIFLKRSVFVKQEKYKSKQELLEKSGKAKALISFKEIFDGLRKIYCLLCESSNIGQQQGLSILYYTHVFINQLCSKTIVTTSNNFLTLKLLDKEVYGADNHRVPS